jgi:hypothetical protein
MRRCARAQSRSSNRLPQLLRQRSKPRPGTFGHVGLLLETTGSYVPVFMIAGSAYLLAGAGVEAGGDPLRAAPPHDGEKR